MDWLTLWSAFLMVLFVSGQASAGTRKKIRIHIPQKVKHIHHHKKIYITQHPTQMAGAEQYAPQFAGAEYLPVSLEALALEPVALMSRPEERRSARPAPNLQPQYRARGHYGPPSTRMTVKRVPKSQTEKRIRVIKITDGKKKRIIRKKPKRIIVQDGDAQPGPSYHDDFYSDIKTENDQNFKTVRKPKRVEKYMDGDTEHIHTYSEEHIHQYVYDDPKKAKPEASGSTHALLPLDVALQHAMRAPVVLPAHPTYVSAPHPTVHAHLHPVMSSPHPYSVLYDSAGQSSVHSPPPTAHHIHSSPAPGITIQSTASTKHQTINTMIDGLGSLGTPPHMEYAGYDANDATHEHLFHDHGEIIHNMGFPKQPAANKAPQVNAPYHTRPYSGKPAWVPQNNGVKANAHGHDYSYAEPSHSTKQKAKKNPANYGGKYIHAEETRVNSEVGYEDVEQSDPLSGYMSSSTHYGNNKHKSKRLHVSDAHSNQKVPKKPKQTVQSYLNKYHSGQPHHNKHLNPILDDKPYGSIAHHSADPDYYKSTASNIRDTKGEYAESYKSYDVADSYAVSPYSSPDAFGSSSTERKKNKEFVPPVSAWRSKKNKNSKKKSISTQNISFGGQDHKTVVDHFADSSEVSPTVATSPYSGRGSEYDPIAIDFTYAPSESYYSVMASKAFEGPSPIPEASSNNFRIVEAPQMRHSEAQMTDRSIVVEPSTTVAAPSTQAPIHVVNHASNHLAGHTPSSTKPPRRVKKKTNEKKNKPSQKEVRPQAQQDPRPKPPQEVRVQMPQPSQPTPVPAASPPKQKHPAAARALGRGKYKYGDRLQDRYDYEYDELIFV